MVGIYLIWGGGMWQNVHNSAILLVSRDLLEERRGGASHECDRVDDVLQDVPHFFDVVASASGTL